MDLNCHNNDDEEFKLMFTLHFDNFRTSLLDTPPGALRRLTSLTSSPFAGTHNDTPRPENELKGNLPEQSASKMLSFAGGEETPQDMSIMSAIEQLDLNKTYCSKTMNSKELTVMLSAMEE